MTSLAQGVDQLLGPLVLRREVRLHEDDRDGLRVVVDGLVDGGDAREGAHAVDDSLRRLLVAVDVDDDRDGSVEPWAEALGQQVVRLARRLLLRLCPLVGGAEADEGRRSREHEARDEQHREHDLRVSRDEPAPAGDGSLLPALFRIVDRTQERHLQPVDLVPELREHRDQQRVRDQNGGEDAERRADAELRHEVEAEDGEAAHRDRDGQACEQHRPACGSARLGCGIGRRHAVVQELSEPCDDEERVVDADTDPDHRTSSGVIVLTSVSPARRKSRRNAVATAVMASASGIVVATKVRKTIISTIRAASRPSSSCLPCSIGGNSASPLNSTCHAGRLDRFAYCILDCND